MKDKEAVESSYLGEGSLIYRIFFRYRLLEALIIKCQGINGANMTTEEARLIARAFASLPAKSLLLEEDIKIYDEETIRESDQLKDVATDATVKYMGSNSTLARATPSQI